MKTLSLLETRKAERQWNIFHVTKGREKSYQSSILDPYEKVGQGSSPSQDQK